MQLYRSIKSMAARAIMVLAVAAMQLGASGQTPSTPADLAIEIGSRLQLFLDDHLIDALDGARLRMHAPTEREAVFELDQPWEGGTSAYVTVLDDGGRFRLYYRGGGELAQEVTCLAQSEDGIHWTRPTLGLFEFDGSKDNNIIWRGKRKAYGACHNFTPFIDTNPDALPERRYKAIAIEKFPDVSGDVSKMLIALASPDGIHWKWMHDGPIIREGGFDSQNVAFWDSVRQEYVCYSRVGVQGVRSVQRHASKDFINWTGGEPLDFGDGELEHFYTNAISPYHRNPRLYIGLPMRFVPQRKTIGEDQRKIDGVSDAVLISSRDGLHFDRTFREAFIRPGLDPMNWGNAHGNNTPAWGIIQTSDTELSIYWAQRYGDIPILRRGTLRIDGFASLYAPDAGGEAVTLPLRVTGNKLVINFATSAVGSVRVELQDAAGNPLRGYTLEDCEEVFGDAIERTLSWQNRTDLPELAGRPIRLRFVLRDADVYAFCFRSK